MEKFDINSLYCSMFIEETQEQIEKIEQDLLSIESGEADVETINNIFRMAHSIKGASATIGIDVMTELSHHLESLLEKIRAKQIIIDSQVMDICFKSIDILKDIHQSLSSGKTYYYDLSEFVKQIQFIIKDKTNYTANELNTEGENELKKDSKDIEEVDVLELNDFEIKLCNKIDDELNVFKIGIVLEKNVKMKAVKSFLIVNNLSGVAEIINATPENFQEISDEDFGDIFKIVIATDCQYEDIYKNINSISEIKEIHINKIIEGKKKEKVIPSNVNIIKGSNPAKEKKKSVRVDVNKIDKLFNLVGEFIIDKEKLNQISMILDRKYSNDPLIKKLLKTLPHLDFLGSELQETVMSTRMLPLEHIFNRFPRMVRDLSKRFNKKIDFVMEGKNTEIDRHIIEELLDPLTHILRNSIDHGLEGADERRSKKKKENGLLKLTAKHEEGSVVIEVEDDGRGIDINKIGKKAVEKKLISEDQLNKLSELQILNFMFEPGFSTADEISDVSGRGVGLDVVKSNIGRLNGIIDVKTDLGIGTRFTIKLPLTLAIVQALLIKEEDYIFSIPIYSIIEMLRVKGKEINERIHKISGYEVFNWREQFIPVIRIGQYFEVSSKINDDKIFVVVVGHSEKKVALIIEKVIGEQEIVIKSMADYIGEGSLFGEVKGISGVSILGDGSFAHIIDIASII